MEYTSVPETANSPPQPAKEDRVTRDVEWFKDELRKVGVSPLTIIWHAEAHFSEVELRYMDAYISYRQFHLHPEALERARREVGEK